MKKVIAIILSLAMAMIFTACSGEETQLNFGTAGIGGSYYSFGSVFAQLVQKEDTTLSFNVQDTAGSKENLRLLSEGKLDLALAQSDLIKDDNQGYKAIASLYTESCHIVVRTDSSIQSVSDLKDKKVSIGEKESGTEQNANQIFDAYGITEDMLSKVNLTYAESAKQLADGEIDAFFVTAGTPTIIIGELAKTCNIRLLSLDEEVLDKLISTYSFYTKSSIKAGTYNGQDKKVITLGVKAVLLARDSLSSGRVLKITQFLFEHAQELQYSVSTDLQLLKEKDALAEDLGDVSESKQMEIDTESVTDSITISFHSGAAAYYEQLGVKVDTGK